MLQQLCNSQYAIEYGLGHKRIYLGDFEGVKIYGMRGIMEGNLSAITLCAAAPSE